MEGSVLDPRVIAEYWTGAVVRKVDRGIFCLPRSAAVARCVNRLLPRGVPVAPTADHPPIHSRLDHPTAIPRVLNAEWFPESRRYVFWYRVEAGRAKNIENSMLVPISSLMSFDGSTDDMGFSIYVIRGVWTSLTRLLVVRGYDSE